jgi:hypothetical protein
MTQGSGTGFDSRTTTLLKEVLAQVEETLPMQQRSSEVRVKIGTCILKAAAGGERDPERLRNAALAIVRSTAQSKEKGLET